MLELAKSNTPSVLAGGGGVVAKHEGAHDPKSSAPETECALGIDLNTPSISGELAGATTFKRTFKAVLGDHGGDGTVRFKVEAMTDKASSFHIKVSPHEFVVSEGTQASVYITVTPKDDTPMFTPQLGQVSEHAAPNVREAR